MSDHWTDIQKKLNQIRDKDLFRSLVPAQGIDLCSNDYLCLSKHPALIEAFSQGIVKYGTGSTASRLVRGHCKESESWEAEFSEFVGSEAALTVTNGFVANSGLLETIANPETIVYSDRLNHASLLDGIRISGAIKKYYEHLDLDHLELLLQKQEEKERNGERSKRKIIITESIFSMEGDAPDFAKLLSLKKQFNAILIVDEAHAFGVFGPEGKGYLFEVLSKSQISEVDYRIYTLGKSMGLFGGMIATRQIGVNFLINAMRPFIFSTALPPALFPAARTSLSILRQMDLERTHLKKIMRKAKEGLDELHFPQISSISQIVPILLNEAKEALDLAQNLKKEGFDVKAIRPPSVPTSRLRLSLNTGVSESVLDRFLSLMGQLKT